VSVGRYPVAVGIGPVMKSGFTIGSNNTSFLNSVTRTRNQTNNTEMTANVGAAGKHERESIPTKASIPFLSSIWTLISIIGAVAFARKVK
jgi:hypothetical protein